MARFRNSNRRAAEDTVQAHSSEKRQRRVSEAEPYLFQRLRYDYAMI